MVGALWRSTSNIGAGIRIMTENVLILGGGIGGVAAANALRKRVRRRVGITVVDREPTFTLAASFLWVMSGARTPAQISRPLERLARKGIDVVRGQVERIDPERREAVVNGRAIRGDRLIVALGAEFALDAVPGWPRPDIPSARSRAPPGCATRSGDSVAAGSSC